MSDTAEPSMIPTLLGFGAGWPFLVAAVTLGVSGSPNAVLLAGVALVVGGTVTLLAGAFLYSAPG
jgi:hypothetical protein